MLFYLFLKRFIFKPAIQTSKCSTIVLRNFNDAKCKSYARILEGMNQGSGRLNQVWLIRSTVWPKTKHRDNLKGVWTRPRPVHVMDWARAKGWIS